MALAKVQRKLGDAAGERESLQRLARLDNDAVEVFLRLAELAVAAGDWEAVLARAEQILAVNPLINCTF